MRRSFLTAVSILFACISFSQECRLTLSGHIEDADTKEKLAGATVFIRELHKYFITDANGDFKLSNLCSATYTLEVSHAGCETVYRSINLTKNQHADILLPHLRNNLNEVVVEAKVPAPTGGLQERVTKQQLEASRTFSIGEALANINGVTLLQTGSTISKPVIHGLHSMRVLTINNGVRQEGQQWGNEHAPEIDTYIAGNLSVLQGAEALRYGSDAVGGVVLVDPKPLRSLPGKYIEANTAYSTNNRMYTASAIFEHQPEKLSALSYRLQGTFKKAANITTPDYRLNNTGMEEKNFSITGNWKKEHYQLQAYYSQFSSDIGIFTGSHIGNLTDLMNVISKKRPDDVFLGENTYEIGRPRQEVLHRLFKLKSDFQINEHKFSFTFGGQYNHRDEFNIVRSTTNTRPQVSLAVVTTSEEFLYEHPAFGNLKGKAGISLMQQENSYSGRYLIPNYNLNNYGAFWIEKWSRDRLTVEGGVRFDDKSISTKRLRFNGVRTDHDFHFTTFGSSLNSVYALSGSIKIKLNAGLTSRAPHVNELLVDGVHEGSGTYEQGDINLKPEKAFEVSGGVEFSNKNRTVSGEVHAYRNAIDDFIYQQPQPNEPVLTIVGAFPLIRYQQTDAILNGMDASLKVALHRNVQLSSRLSILRATNRATDDWLILMPADRWRNEVIYNLPHSAAMKDTYVSAEVVSVFRPRTPSDAAGKQDYMEAPGPYTLVNMHASTTVGIFKTPVTIALGVRNLFNTSYRDYLNSFRYYTDEIGRNITVMLKVPFQSEK